MSVAGVFVLAVLVSVVLGLLLAVLVWSENEREPMDRRDAERVARRDTGEHGSETDPEDSRWE